MKILIADDETPIREWIQFSIERGNNPDFEVVGAAENGVEAMKIAREHQVDVIITDIRMPGMDGLMLMKNLQQELPDIAFIILTNYAEFSYAREAITYGAKRYLLKSEMRGADILDALQELQEHLDRRKKHKEQDNDSDGYLDIYYCYNNQHDRETVSDFWKKHGFEEQWMFRILALRREEIQDQKQVIHDFLKSAEGHVIRPILHQNFILLLVQASDYESLELRTETLRKTVLKQYQGIFAISDDAKGSDSIYECIEETEKLMQYALFFEAGSFRWDESALWKPLNREKIKQEMRRIIDSILHVEKDEVVQSLQEWFSVFSEKQFHRKDVEWASGICMKMVMHVEDILSEKILDYHEEHGGKMQLTVSECSSLCQEMTDLLYSDEMTAYSQIVRDIISYIRQNYDKPKLSLKEVAKVTYRSPEYLSRLFKAETGKNFSVFLTEFRLERAKELLQGTDMKIYEIAYAVGYSNPSYFSKVYHEFMGVTPEMTKSRK